ncbi:PilW family protein [Burkholderia plantarii]|uniref:PilW family protein n=1 Tax=Burkholderia plantarii TaxID=41899 RepID=UPI0018DD6CDB|nr:PilW family protein [Burkholderia plantarii]MBI0326182.1 PilW family protein [Burkholderia plantarii]
MRRQRQRAHTLVEALVALALAAFVLAAAVALYRTQRAAYGASVDAARARDAAAVALTLVAQSVRMAGFVPLDARVAGFAPLFGCASGRVAGDAMRPACVAETDGSDGLLMRYVGDAVSTWPTADGRATDCLGQGVGIAGDRPLIVNRYFVRSGRSAGGPELYCEGSGRPGVAQPLVEGIERLRLRYRLRGQAAWRDASALSADAWREVVAIDVCVQVRGAAPAPAARYLDCDGAEQRSRDGRRRWIARRWLSLRNAGPPVGMTGAEK